MMRILLLTTDAFGGHGGIALYNRDLAEALASFRFVREVVVVPRKMPFPPGSLPEKVTLLSDAVGGKVRYVLQSIRAAADRYDIVICGHVHLLPLAALLNLRIRAPIILLAYGIEVWKPALPFAKAFLRQVDAVWTISRFTGSTMNSWADLPASMFLLLPNAVHLDRYGMKSRNLDLQRRLGLGGGKVIMTLGRVEESVLGKGFDKVLEAMPALLRVHPDVQYVIAGKGRLTHSLETRARDLGIADRVIFTGMVREEDKADLLRLADAFVMPSKGEGFGFVFLEAMACGVPVVGSCLDGSREALRDGRLGELVDPDVPGSVLGGILRALQKPSCIPPGIDAFDWPAFRSRLEAALQSVTKSAGPTEPRPQ